MGSQIKLTKSASEGICIWRMVVVDFVIVKILIVLNEHSGWFQCFFFCYLQNVDQIYITNEL